MTDEPPDEEPAEADQSHTPALLRDGFDCPRCGVWSHQVWSETYERTDLGFVRVDVIPGKSTGSRSVFSASETLRTARCAKCNGASLWVEDRMVFPSSSPAPAPHPEMPDDARVLYEEAAAVFATSRRAGAAMARSALELLLRTEDPMTGRPNLAERIDHVSARVSTALDELLAVVRHAGNQSLHVGEQADDLLVLVLDPAEEEIAELLFIAINDLTDELVSKPKRARGAFERIPEGVRKKIEEAREKKA